MRIESLAGRVGVGLALVVVLVSCGGGTPRRNPRATTEPSTACVAGADPEACLRFIERVVPVRSLRLTGEVSLQVTASCRAAARMTRLWVICPPTVPAGGVVADHSLYGPQIVNAGTYSVSINNGQNPGHIHWEFGAIKGPATRLWVFDRSNWDALPPKHPARRVGERRYHGHLITLYRFPDSDGQLEGHDAAFATEHGVSYFVSIHGHAQDDADVAMLLAVLFARDSG